MPTERSHRAQNLTRGALLIVALLVATECAVAQGSGGRSPEASPPASSTAAAAGLPAVGAQASETSPQPSEPATEKQAAPESDEPSAAERFGLDLSSDAPLEIDSQVFDILDAKTGGEQLKFTGNVVLRQGDLKLTCSELDAYYPEGSQGTPQRIVAQGDVRVSQGDVELRCTRAEFDNSRCVTVCRSSESCGSDAWPAQPASLQRGQDVIEGRELQFDLCTGQLSARCGARMKVQPRQDPKSADDASSGSASSDSSDSDESDDSSDATRDADAAANVARAAELP